MVSDDLFNIISLLRSNKEKDRQKGIDTFRNNMSSIDWANVHADDWVVLVKEIAGLIERDIDALASKVDLSDRSIALRTSKIAGLGRDFAKICGMGMKYPSAFGKSLNPALNYLMDGLISGTDSFFQPLIGNAKVIRAFVAIQPIRDHITSKTWTKLFSTCKDAVESISKLPKIPGEGIEMARILAYISMSGPKLSLNQFTNLIDLIAKCLSNSMSDTTFCCLLLKTFYFLVLEYFPQLSNEVLNSISLAIPTVLNIWITSISRDKSTVLKYFCVSILRVYICVSEIHDSPRPQLEDIWNLCVAEFRSKKGLPPLESMDLLTSFILWRDSRSISIYLSTFIDKHATYNLDLESWAFINLAADVIALLLKPETGRQPRKRKASSPFEVFQEILTSLPQRRTLLLQTLCLTFTKFVEAKDLADAVHSAWVSRDTHNNNLALSLVLFALARSPCAKSFPCWMEVATEYLKSPFTPTQVLVLSSMHAFNLVERKENIQLQIHNADIDFMTASALFIYSSSQQARTNTAFESLGLLVFGSEKQPSPTTIHPTFLASLFCTIFTGQDTLVSDSSELIPIMPESLLFEILFQRLKLDLPGILKHSFLDYIRTSKPLSANIGRNSFLHDLSESVLKWKLKLGAYASSPIWIVYILTFLYSLIEALSDSGYLTRADILLVFEEIIREAWSILLPTFHALIVGSPFSSLIPQLLILQAKAPLKYRVSRIILERVRTEVHQRLMSPLLTGTFVHTNLSESYDTFGFDAIKDFRENIRATVANEPPYPLECYLEVDHAYVSSESSETRNLLLLLATLYYDSDVTPLIEASKTIPSCKVTYNLVFLFDLSTWTHPAEELIVEHLGSVLKQDYGRENSHLIASAIMRHTRRMLNTSTDVSTLRTSGAFQFMSFYLRSAQELKLPWWLVADIGNCAIDYLRVDHGEQILLGMGYFQSEQNQKFLPSATLRTLAGYPDFRIQKWFLTTAAAHKDCFEPPEDFDNISDLALVACSILDATNNQFLASILKSGSWPTLRGCAIINGLPSDDSDMYLEHLVEAFIFTSPIQTTDAVIFKYNTIHENFREYYDLPQFVNDHAGRLIGTIIGDTGANISNDLNLLGLTFETILSNCFSDLVCHALLGPNPINVLNAIAAQMGSREKLISHIQRKLSSILFKVIRQFGGALMSATTGVLEPTYRRLFCNIIAKGRSGQKQIGELLNSIKTLQRYLGLPDSFLWSCNRVMFIIQRFQEAFVAEIHKRDSIADSFAVAIPLFGETIKSPPILRAILQTMGILDVSERVHLIFRNIKAVVLSNVSQRHELCSAVSLSILELGQALCARPPPLILTHHLDHLDQLLQSLQGSPFRLTCLVLLDLEDPRLARFQNLDPLSSRVVEVKGIIDSLVELDVPNSRHRVVKLILKCVERKDFMELDTGSVFNLVRNFLQASNPLYIEDGLKCLGQLCVLYPHTKLSRPSVKAFGRTLFRLLKDGLEHPILNIRKESYKSIKMLLQQPEGQDLYQSLPPGPKSYFEMFTSNNEKSATIQQSHNGLDIRLFPKLLDDYKTWVTSCTEMMIQVLHADSFLGALASVAKVYPVLAEFLLPYIFQKLLATDSTSNDIKVSLVKSINLIAQHGREPGQSALNILESMLCEDGTDLMGCPIFWQNLDYPIFIACALEQNRHKLAVLLYDVGRYQQPQQHSDDKCLTKLFQHVESDYKEGILSLQTSNGPNEITEYYDHHKQFAKTLGLRESILSTQTTVDHISRLEIAQALGEMGLFHVQSEWCRHWTTVEIADLHYQSLWKCGQWDELNSAKEEKTYHKALWDIGRHLTNTELLFCESSIKSAYNVLGNEDSSKKLELLSLGLKTVPLLISSETVLSMKSNSVQEFRSHIERAKWLLHTCLEQHGAEKTQDSYLYFISLLTRIISNSKVEAQRSEIICKTLGGVSLRFSSSSRKNGQLQLALNVISKCVQVLQNCAGNFLGHDLDLLSNQFCVEEAKILYRQGETHLALRKLRSITDQSLDPLRKAYIRRYISEWSYKGQLENADAIFCNYQTAASLVEQGKKIMKFDDRDCKTAESLHYSFAKFSDNSYELLQNDESYLSLRELIAERRAELLEISRNATVESKQQQRKMELAIRLDEAELSNYLTKIERFMISAIRNYLKSIQYGTRKDLAVFRICSLWFQNHESTSVNQIIQNELPRIQVYKFLDLIYQLSARLTPEDNAFQQTLHTLVASIVKKHPYHSTCQLIALKNGMKSSRKNTPANTAASLLLQSLTSQDHHFRQTYEKLNIIVEAYLQLADAKVPKSGSQKQTIRIDRHMKISQLEDISEPVFTIKHLISIPGGVVSGYEGLDRIHKFASEYKLVGGINAPKVIECISTSGTRYMQLIKGGSDDLRQDAVLSTVFDVVNKFLKKDRETKSRNLNVRTYKVIPLGSQAGVIEWVQNSIPIGEYLTEAHERIRPQDLSPKVARQMMMREQSNSASNHQSKLAVYEQIEEKLKPVFRYFFLERFKDPQEWFERRLEYTRSVAVNSITDWVVGLGDRHTQNILIDTLSGEMIQIDLGVAFDAGKLLSIPELVPFRLTRDIVDGMGYLGMEGPFLRSCKETLRVLREHADVLYTILDVFRHDPLYSWTKEKTSRAERGETSGVTRNRHAERALLGVRRKLKDPVTSVECKVNELIQAATDKNNLSRMYSGWQAWL